MIHLEKYLILFVVICMALKDVKGHFSEDQFTYAMDKMRDECLQKFKSVTPEKTEKVRWGHFPENDKELECYSMCIWERLGAMKNGVFDADHTMDELEVILPVDMVDNYKIGIKQCKDEGNGVADSCKAAYLILECFLALVPNFYFP